METVAIITLAVLSFSLAFASWGLRARITRLAEIHKDEKEHLENLLGKPISVADLPYGKYETVFYAPSSYPHHKGVAVLRGTLGANDYWLIWSDTLPPKFRWTQGPAKVVTEIPSPGPEFDPELNETPD